MFSLGVILYNMAYKYESHPYVGLTYQLFYQKQQKNQSQIFCLSVNNAKQIVFPDEPRRSQEFKDLIKRLCDKNVQDRMSFVELIESDYPYSHLKNKNSNQSALFQSEFKQLSILQFNNRESIFPQPSVSVSQIMKNLDHGQSKVLNQDESQQGLESQLQNIPSILEDNEGEEEDITQSGKEVLHEQSEMELNLQLELMEEEMRRLDKQNSLIFAIFDKCIYLRELVFFYDKVQLHIDNLIHMISKRYPLLKHLDQILARLRLLRIACIYESSERNTSIYRSLLNYYTQNEVNIFLQSKEFQNFEKLRCQDESQLASNKESILNTSFLQLERNQALNCLHDFSDVYESIEEKGDQKLSLVAYWYIYQVYLLLKNTSTFDNIEYERNSNKFIQYYEVIDHHLTIEDLFDKVKEACDFLNIPVIVNL